MREQVVKLGCPICNRPCRGKIGVGVHLARSHTSEERAKLFLAQLMAVIPIMMAVTTIVIGQPIEEKVLL